MRTRGMQSFALGIDAAWTGATVERVWRIFAIVALGALNVGCDGGLIETETDIGSTEIDKIVRWEGHNPGMYPPGKDSPLSIKVRAYLAERAKQGGATAVAAALSESGASCRPPIDHVHHCEIRRYQVLRSADLIGAKYGRTDWTISISYQRRENDVRSIDVTYSETGELLQ